MLFLDQLDARYPQIFLPPFNEKERKSVIRHMGTVKKKVSEGTFRFTNIKTEKLVKDILMFNRKSEKQLTIIHLAYLQHWNIKHGDREFTNYINKAWDKYLSEN